ncbi:MAG: nucleotide exchange factor GrpE [Flavobacteriales bacterium]
MAKNLTSRMRKIFRPMNQEDVKEPSNAEETANQQNAQPQADALTDPHNPDIGEPETKQEEPKGEINPEEKLRAEAADWRDKYLRLYAEFDNFRKRSQKERVDLLQTASADLMKELLNVLDDFDRAVKANETVEDINAVKEGFVLIHQKLYRKLETKGLKPLNATGEVFDTDFHEAITQIPAPTDDMKGKVVDEVEKGYTLNDKVIRFSKVVIGQ